MCFFSPRRVSQSGRFSSHTYQAESIETVFGKVLNKVSDRTEEKEDEGTVQMLLSK